VACLEPSSFNARQLAEVPEAVAARVRPLVVDGMSEGMASFVTSVPIVVEASVRRKWAGEG
jgi:hypothetical protein